MTDTGFNMGSVAGKVYSLPPVKPCPQCLRPMLKNNGVYECLKHGVPDRP